VVVMDFCGRFGAATLARGKLRIGGSSIKLTLVQWMLALVVAAEVVPILAKLFQ
jgi:hypothetical protein